MSSTSIQLLSAFVSVAVANLIALSFFVKIGSRMQDILTNISSVLRILERELTNIGNDFVSPRSTSQSSGNDFDEKPIDNAVPPYGNAPTPDSYSKE